MQVKDYKRYAGLFFTLLLVCLSIACHFAFTPEEVAVSQSKSICVLLCYTFTYCFISIATIRRLIENPFVKHNQWLIVLGMIFLSIGIHCTLHYLQRPTIVTSTIYFTEGYRIFNGNLPFTKLGEVYIDSVLLLLFAVIGNRYIVINLREKDSSKSSLHFFAIAFFLLLFFLYFYGVNVFLAEIVNKNVFGINPSRLLFFEGRAFIIYSIIFALLYSFSLFTIRGMKLLFQFCKRKTDYLVVTIFIIFVISSLICFFIDEKNGISRSFLIIALFLYSGLVILLTIGRKPWMQWKFTSKILNLIFFSAFSALMFSNVIEDKEEKNREMFVNEIISNTSSVTDEQKLNPATIKEIYHEIYAPEKYAEPWGHPSKRHLNRNYIETSSKLSKQYAFAYYINGHLADQYGTHGYNLKVEKYLHYAQNSTKRYFITDGYQHFLYKVSPTEYLIISRSKDFEHIYIAYFAFFFIIYILFSLVVFLSEHLFILQRSQVNSLYNNLLWISFGVLMFVHLSVCVFSIRHNIQQDVEDQREEAMNKLSHINHLLIKDIGFFYQISKTPESDELIQQTINRISNSLFVDINFYDTCGVLKYSSITGEPLRTAQLPREIAEHFSRGESYYFYHDTLYYHSIYHIFKSITDETGKRYGFLNINNHINRYNWEMKLSMTMTRYLNILAAMIWVAIIVSCIICRFILKQLEPIKMALYKREHANDKISVDWNENEEIGMLIREHNRMVEELRMSTELQVKREREHAWHEMAKEVAHEIRNPLTPIRLKLQMLQYAWANRRSDFDERIQKITDELVEQVDILARIADTFNEYANSYQYENRLENLKEILSTWETIYASTFETTYHFHCKLEREAPALIDKRLYEQMFGYIVKNFNNNRVENRKLNIETILTTDSNDNYWLLTIRANDRGLDVTDISVVFSPRFSNTHAGYGLYLPVVKNIVTGFRGEISFSTEPGEGTEFYIKIPKA